MFKKLMLIAVLVLAMGAGAFLVPVSADHGTEGLAEQCPDHSTNEKVTATGGTADDLVTIDGQEIQVVIDGDEVKFFGSEGDPIEVEFCIKASNHASGKQTGSSGAVTWTNNGHQTPDISYVVVYAVVDEEPREPEEPTTPVGPTTTDEGRTLGTTSKPGQVAAPVGGVQAGAGGSAMIALYGLGGSLATLGLGALRLRKSE